MKEIIIGRSPQNSKEVVVDMVLAKQISAQFGNRATLNSVIGTKVTLNNRALYSEVEIVGIISGSQKAVFGTEDFYVNWCCAASSNLFGKLRYYEKEVDSLGNPLYEIISGNDLVPLDNDNLQVLLPEGSEYLGQSFVEIDKILYDVVGVYRFKDGTIPLDKEILISNVPVGLKLTKLYPGVCAAEDEYIIIEGRKPETLDECIISVYMDYYEIGDFITVDEVKYKIVGIYNGTTKTLSSKFIQTKESYIFHNYRSSEICFTLATDESNIITVNNEIPIKLYDLNLTNKEENKENNIVLYQLLFFVLIFICSVFVYLVMRSRLIAMVYEVGVKRSIGATKGKMLGKFFADALIISTLFSLIGYVIILVLYGLTADIVNYYLEKRFLITENSYYSIGLIVMYIINIAFGMLPIVSLLRKTPAEICAKYDI